MKKGITLIEVLVAVFIFTIGIGGFSLLFINSWKTNSVSVNKGISSVLATRSLDKIIKNLRRAQTGENGDYLLKKGEDFELIFYADINNDNMAERIRYYLDGGNIFEGISYSTGSVPFYNNEDDEINIIAKNIVNTEDVPLFYYFQEGAIGDLENFSNNSMETPVEETNVGLIGVRMIMKIGVGGSAEEIEVKSMAKLRNKK